MKRLTIAVDVDDVLLPNFQALVGWHNRTYGTSLVLADNGSEDLTRWGADSPEEAIRRVQVFFDSDEFKAIRPFEDARRALAQLNERYDLMVLTARDTIIEATTREWISEHFADLFREVHFTAKYSLEGKRRQKADVLRETKASYLIDDALENIIPATDVGIRGLLYGDYPWNQTNSLSGGVTRVKDWAAVLQYFDEQG